MRVALVGWYGHQNAGDDRLEYAVRSLLRGMFVTAYDFDQWRWLPPLLARYDFVILGGGTLFTDGNNGIRRARWMLERAGRPFAVLGIGVDRVPEEYRCHLRWLLAHARLFTVRDRASLEQCAAVAPGAVLAPDLTWLVPYPLHPRGSSPGSVAVNLANYGTANPQLARGLLQVAPRYLKGMDLFSWPFSKDLETADGPFLSCWFRERLDANEMGLPPDTRFCVAHRYHAMVFAAQMGVPFIPVVTQKKGAAFLREIEYPVPQVQSGAVAEWERALGYLLDHEEKLAVRLAAVRECFMVEAAELKAAAMAAMALPESQARALRRRLRAVAGRLYRALLAHRCPHGSGSLRPRSEAVASTAYTQEVASASPNNPVSPVQQSSDGGPLVAGRPADPLKR